jgi:hypothetical protein
MQLFIYLIFLDLLCEQYFVGRLLAKEVKQVEEDGYNFFMNLIFLDLFCEQYLLCPYPKKQYRIDYHNFYHNFQECQ